MPLGLSVQKGSTGIPPTSPEAAFYRPKHAEQLGKPPHSSVTTRAANQAEGPKDALKDPLESLGLRVSALKRNPFCPDLFPEAQTRHPAPPLGAERLEELPAIYFCAYITIPCRFV